MTEAYVISAFMQGGSGHKPVVGVLFGSAPTVKDLKAMGFLRIQSTEQVATNGDAPTEPTLYVFDRSPAAKEVTIVRIGERGAIIRSETKQGEPCSIIPEVRGTAATRFITPRNGLSVHNLRGNGATSARISERRLRC